VQYGRRGRRQPDKPLKRPASAPSRLVARLRKLLGASRREQRGGPARLLPEDFDPEAID
jgi:hypothetical protein